MLISLIPQPKVTGGHQNTHRDIEKHVALLIQILEPTGIIREPIPRIRRAGIAQENALHLAGKEGRHEWIIAHDIRIAGIGDEDKLALRKGLEDLDEQELADRERGRDVGEVEGPGVEGAAGVGLVDEVHVVARDLLGRRGQVVEVEVVDGFGPVGVDLRHVHPGHEGAREGVQQAFFRLVDLGDA